jgi:hypothetical protein
MVVSMGENRNKWIDLGKDEAEDEEAAQLRRTIAELRKKLEIAEEMNREQYETMMHVSKELRLYQEMSKANRVKKI